VKKKFYISLLACLVLFFYKALSQQNYTLQSSYGGDYMEEVASIIPNQFNDLVIIGPTSSFPSIPPIGINAQFYVTKITSPGNQSWGVVEGDLDELDLPFAAIETYDNKYLAVGYASYQGTPNQIPGDIRLLKIDEDGNIVYSKLIEYGGVTSAGRDICYTPDGNYLITGERIDSFAWKHYPLLTKINENGDVIWTKDYKQDTIVSTYRIRQAHDGGYFALGQNSVYLSNSVLVRYSEDGEVLWWKDLRDMGEGYDGIEMIYDLEIDSEGNLFIIVNGHFTTYIPLACLNQAAEFSYLLEMNPSGEVIKRKIFCSSNAGPTVFNDLVITTDGGIFLSSRIGVLKLNADWETEWQLDNIFEEGIEYQVKKIGQFEDNSFYGVGEVVKGDNNTDYFIVRIPEDGVNSVTTILNNKEILSVYPNPASNILTIELSIPDIAEYKIYDITGQLIHQSTIKTPTTTIDITSLAVGIYVIQLQTQQGVVSKKFVKQ